MPHRHVDVSVVIPCRDHAIELGRCLGSVRAQTFAGSFEIVVVDAGLDDEVARVEDARVEQDDTRVVTRVVRGREPLGPGQARNLGATHSRGRALCFIDADAVAEPGWLEAALATLEAGARVAGGAVLHGEPWHPVATIDNLMQFSDFPPGRPPGPAVLLPTCNLAISRADFAAAGGFPVLEFTAGEDVLFCESVRRRWPGSLRFDPSMRVRHYGRGTLQALWRHQDRFGYIRARCGLRLTQTHRRLGRSMLLVPLLSLRRIGYLVARAFQWQPAALLVYVLALPVLMIGLTAWCRGFHRGLRTSPAPGSPQLEESR
jgi:glycosyltransferase involved in cell wall biosynthesis